MHGDLVNTQSSPPRTRCAISSNTIKDAGTALGVAMQPALERVLGHRERDSRTTCWSWADRYRRVYVTAWLEGRRARERIESHVRGFIDAMRTAGGVAVDAVGLMSGAFEQLGRDDCWRLKRVASITIWFKGAFGQLKRDTLAAKDAIRRGL